MRKLGKGKIRTEKKSYNVTGELCIHPHAMRFCTLVRKGNNRGVSSSKMCFNIRSLFA